MRVDGQNVRRLTSSPGVDDDPVWSPDSKQIVFESERAGNLDIWIMDADGGNLRQLTSDPARDWSADWIWKPQ
jgi:Tol biopolymer transport system component